MFFYSLASMIPFTVLLALVVVSVRAIWLAVMPPRRCVKEASCEKCRYPVAGLSTWTCPECGSHLLTVGIVTRSMEMRRRGSYIGAIGGLFFLLFISGLITTYVAFMTLGWGVLLGVGGTHVSSTPVTESTGALPAMVAVFEQNPDSDEQLTILRPAAAGAFDELRVEWGRDYQRIGSDGAVVSEGRLSKEVVVQWMADAGVDTTKPGAESAIAELHALLSDPNASMMWSPGQTLQSFTVGATTSTTRPAKGEESAHFWFLAILWSIPAVGLLLFAVFTYLIIRRRSGLLRDALKQELGGGVPAIAPPIAPPIA